MSKKPLFSLAEDYFRADDLQRQNLDRSLPLQDLTVDRWERAQRLGFGEGASVYNSCFIFGKPEIGANVWIGPYVIIEAAGGRVSIGDWCILSANVQVYSHNTIARALTLGRAPDHVGEVKIGKGCYFGPNCLVSAGTRIGDRCIVAAGSVVKGEYGDQSFIAGNPAKLAGNVVLEEENGYRIELAR